MKRVSRGMSFPDQPNPQAWENMRAEILHEIQEDATLPDEQLDCTPGLARMLTAPSETRQARREAATASRVRL